MNLNSSQLEQKRSRCQSVCWKEMGRDGLRGTRLVGGSLRLGWVEVRGANGWGFGRMGLLAEIEVRLKSPRRYLLLWPTSTEKHKKAHRPSRAPEQSTPPEQSKKKHKHKHNQKHKENHNGNHNNTTKTTTKTTTKNTTKNATSKSKPQKPLQPTLRPKPHPPTTQTTIQTTTRQTTIQTTNRHKPHPRASDGKKRRGV